MYLLDKRFVDPRRPKGPPMDAQKAEMLPPYQEEIGFVPQFFATHRETVERLSSAPAALFPRARAGRFSRVFSSD